MSSRNQRKKTVQPTVQPPTPVILSITINTTDAQQLIEKIKIKSAENAKITVKGTKP